MRAMLPNTLSLSRDSPQPSQVSALEYSTMVNTSCSAMVRFSKRTRNTVPSEETTVAGRLEATAGGGKVRCTCVWGMASIDSPKRMLVPPEDISIVSPAIRRPSESLAITGVTTLMRTVVRNCLISRATAVQTPRTMTLNMHHNTFMTTVPGRSRSQMKKRGMAMIRPARLKASMMRNGCAILVSKNVLLTTPPLAVTLNLPSLGLMRAINVGNRM